MKNLLILLCGILVFASCSKNVEMPNTIEQSVTTKATNKQTSKHKFVAELQISDAMLSFNSKEEMDETIAKLIFMKEDDLVVWYKKANPNFTSQEMIYRNAIDDLTLLESFDEAITFKAKYSPYLLFNNDPADEELYNPYLPNADYVGLSYVANANGNVLIAGKTVNLNKNITSVKNLETYKLKKASFNQVQTKAYTEYTNQMYITNTSKGRHINVKAYHLYSAKGVSVHAELKNWLGWNTYRADWSFQSLSSGALAPTDLFYFANMKYHYPNAYVENSLPSGHMCPMTSFSSTTNMRFHIWTSGLTKDDTGIFRLQI